MSLLRFLWVSPWFSRGMSYMSKCQCCCCNHHYFNINLVIFYYQIMMKILKMWQLCIVISEIDDYTAVSITLLQCTGNYYNFTCFHTRTQPSCDSWDKQTPNLQILHTKIFTFIRLWTLWLPLQLMWRNSE